MKKSGAFRAEYRAKILCPRYFLHFFLSRDTRSQIICLFIFSSRRKYPIIVAPKSSTRNIKPRDSLLCIVKGTEIKKKIDVEARSRIRPFLSATIFIATFLVSIRPDILTPGCVRGKTDRVDRSCSLEVSMDFSEPSDEVGAVGNSFQRFNNFFFEFLKIYTFI